MESESRAPKVISSSIEIDSTVENIWDKITNVRIEHFRFPWYFRLMNIPKPVRAEILTEGVGGERVAYFENGRRFTQEIIAWDEFRTYSFTFRSKDEFRAGYIFNIFQGAFRISKGTYVVSDDNNRITVELTTDYSISKKHSWLLARPTFLILSIFQGYLLNTIKVNSELKKGS